MVAKGKEWREGILKEFGTNSYILLYLKWIINKGLLYSTGNSTECYMATWMGGEFVGEWIHTHTHTHTHTHIYIYIYIYVWVSLLFTWSYHNIVNWLYAKMKQKVFKKAELTKQKTQWNKTKISQNYPIRGAKRMQRNKGNLQELWMPLGETRYPRCLLSPVWLFATPWTVAGQAPLSMGFSRPEYWNGLPCPSPCDLPDPGIESMPLTFPELAGGFFTTTTTWKGQCSGSNFTCATYSNIICLI